MEACTWSRTCQDCSLYSSCLWRMYWCPSPYCAVVQRDAFPAWFLGYKGCPFSTSFLYLLVSWALFSEATLPMLYHTSSSMGQVKPHEFSFQPLKEQAEVFKASAPRRTMRTGVAIVTALTIVRSKYCKLLSLTWVAICSSFLASDPCPHSTPLLLML